MMRLFFVLLLFSFNSWGAVEWASLKKGQTYELSQSFKLAKYDGSTEFLEFKMGDRVELLEVLPLDIAFPVIAYIFKYQNCSSPEASTALEIIPVQGTSPVVEIGAQLESGCELTFYNETKDSFYSSIFE